MMISSFERDVFIWLLHANQVKETAENVDDAVRELPDANLVMSKFPLFHLFKIYVSSDEVLFYWSCRNQRIYGPIIREWSFQSLTRRIIHHGEQSRRYAIVENKYLSIFGYLS